MKITLEEINSRLEEQDQINNLEDKVAENTQQEQAEKNFLLINEDSSQTSETTLNVTISVLQEEQEKREQGIENLFE